ncbi:CBL-interacting serine/threonine-protein kinase 9-like isoform X2 [Vigna umbellata]|uniref:CBL-interacting serine/threonine-protein kinase 9-like isoform X2 n=1 Tax=Vigna umbellata TaxID=87088 RepID=UPI001F5FE237|nr:CBL-interacting serine/threonine-protein kinase 9-like isoform X2 [Vigna umbellata]
MSFKVAKGGVVVGKYELGKTIGEGSFAKVKFARDVNNGNNVAIKILDRKHVLRHNMMEQLQREISTMRLIDHPNVTKIFEVMASKTKIYIVMELLDGGELFDKIAAKGKLEEDEARNYFQQLINAVDYCHSRGVYHRDLKPENLLLDSNSVLKVSDFGLSTYTQKEDELLRTACGTPNYVAPEVIHNKGYVGSTSDIWSCGVILFVLMAGFMPFDAPTHMALFKKVSHFRLLLLLLIFYYLWHENLSFFIQVLIYNTTTFQIIKAEFTCPSWFPPQAKTLLKRILDPNPQTRIKIPELLKDEWFKKGYKPTSFTEEEDLSMDDVAFAFNESNKNLVTERKVKPVYMNAFELISRSQSFNLDSLFEMQTDEVKQETCFTSQCPAIEIMHKIEEAAKPLGFNVQIQNYKMKLQGDQNGRKGHLSMATEVFEVAPSVHMVELRKTGGDTLEFHKFYKIFSSGLQDIFWHTEEKK